jgi:catechol 2,3-dioxygenase-like lactoylglutathione lyase family enzyme
MTGAKIGHVAPLLIVSNVDRTLAFYRDKLRFKTTFQEPRLEPFFAISERDGAQFLFKSDRAVKPMPNSHRHPWIKWDAYIFTSDPDALAEDFLRSGAALSEPVSNTGEGLRGFEITDPDGYVLFFGRPA